jgi:putative PIN family toxin of toxin-antitoxin system
MKITKRFIFDTNTLISAFILSNQTTTARAWYKATEIGQIIVSEETLAEFADVFIRPKFDKYLSAARRLMIIEDFKTIAKMVVPTQTVDLCRDEKDNKYLELALAAKADCIITGDLDLLFLHPFDKTLILSAADFLKAF